MIYLANSFSLQMLADWRLAFDGGAAIRVEPLGDFAAAHRFIDEAESAHGPLIEAIGHADLCEIVSDHLGRIVRPNRTSIKLHDDDVLVVAQYRGPRLPEGATTLPEGARVDYYAITVGDDADIHAPGETSEVSASVCGNEHPKRRLPK